MSTGMSSLTNPYLRSYVDQWTGSMQLFLWEILRNSWTVRYLHKTWLTVKCPLIDDHGMTELHSPAAVVPVSSYLVDARLGNWTRYTLSTLLVSISTDVVSFALCMGVHNLPFHTQLWVTRSRTGIVLSSCQTSAIIVALDGP